MSRSWDENSRKLIHEIRETLRVAFQGVRCYPAAIAMQTPDIGFDLRIPSQPYGGVLLDPHVPVHMLDTRFISISNNLNLPFECPLHTEAAAVPNPVTQTIPMRWENIPLPELFPLLPRKVSVQSNLLTPLRAKLPATPWTMGNLRLTTLRKLSLHNFQKPKVDRVPKLGKTTAHRFSQYKNALPILRKPIPPHRFSSENRTLFRELLAQKAKLPVFDIQLIGVYDRIYLGLYQSLSQSDDGTLYCVPKSQTDLQTSKAPLIPVYLIMGKSTQNAGQVFQTIMPMEDLHRAPAG